MVARRAQQLLGHEDIGTTANICVQRNEASLRRRSSNERGSARARVPPVGAVFLFGREAYELEACESSEVSVMDTAHRDPPPRRHLVFPQAMSSPSSVSPSGSAPSLGSRSVMFQPRRLMTRRPWLVSTSARNPSSARTPNPRRLGAARAGKHGLRDCCHERNLLQLGELDQMSFSGGWSTKVCAGGSIEAADFGDGRRPLRRRRGAENAG